MTLSFQVGSLNLSAAAVEITSPVHPESRSATENCVEPVEGLRTATTTQGAKVSGERVTVAIVRQGRMKSIRSPPSDAAEDDDFPSRLAVRVFVVPIVAEVVDDEVAARCQEGGGDAVVGGGVGIDGLLISTPAAAAPIMYGPPARRASVNGSGDAS